MRLVIWKREVFFMRRSKIQLSFHLQKNSHTISQTISQQSRQRGFLT